MRDTRAVRTEGHGPLSQWLSLPFGYTGRYLVVGFVNSWACWERFFPPPFCFPVLEARKESEMEQL